VPVSDRLLITEAGVPILELTGERVPGLYNKLKRLSCNALIPAQRVDGRWGFDRRDLPVVCRALGLEVPTDRIAA